MTSGDTLRRWREWISGYAILTCLGLGLGAVGGLVAAEARFDPARCLERELRHAAIADYLRDHAQAPERTLP